MQIKATKLSFRGFNNLVPIIVLAKPTVTFVTYRSNSELK